MLELGVKLLLAYLLGTVLGSMLVGAFRGVDIRSMGSGNAGATNAMRTQGKWFGLTVLVIDVAKGLIAVWWLPGALLPGIDIDAEISRPWLTVGCAFAVILGHVFPVWFSFRGGKGFATTIGVVGALEPRLLLALLVCWLVVVMLTGYVGLAAMLSAAALVACVLVFEPANRPLLAFCASVAVFVVYTHRSNIVRMRAGKESRVRRLWLFRSRAA
jgi:acyl phosphate:glycerol-3-phosphate acyltransferase